MLLSLLVFLSVTAEAIQVWKLIDFFDGLTGLQQNDANGFNVRFITYNMANQKLFPLSFEAQIRNGCDEFDMYVVSTQEHNQQHGINGTDNLASFFGKVGFSQVCTNWRGRPLESGSMYMSYRVQVFLKNECGYTAKLVDSTHISTRWAFQSTKGAVAGIVKVTREADSRSIHFVVTSMHMNNVGAGKKGSSKHAIAAYNELKESWKDVSDGIVAMIEKNRKVIPHGCDAFPAGDMNPRTISLPIHCGTFVNDVINDTEEDLEREEAEALYDAHLDKLVKKADTDDKAGAMLRLKYPKDRTDFDAATRLFTLHEISGTLNTPTNTQELTTLLANMKLGDSMRVVKHNLINDKTWKRCFGSWNEDDIEFLPTYRFDTVSGAYNTSPYIPSWCDREWYWKSHQTPEQRGGSWEFSGYKSLTLAKVGGEGEFSDHHAVQRDAIFKFALPTNIRRLRR